VREKTVADSMRRQGLVARKAKRRKGTTRQDRSAPTFPDLLRRDFTAAAPNLRWCGDITEIPTGDGKLYLATVIDLYSRRLVAAATSLRRDRLARRWPDGSSPRPGSPAEISSHSVSVHPLRRRFSSTTTRN
jgi:transposase InsO family protein